MTLSPAVLEVFTTAAQVLKPPPPFTITAWAEEHRMLSTESSAEPGKYRVARVPFQREMQDAILDPVVEEVVFFTGAQLTKSTAIENIFGYFACEDPCTIVWMHQSQEVAKQWSESDLAAYLRDTAPLAQLFEARSRTTKNKTLFKKFPGGALIVVGANSPKNLRGKRARLVLCDEVDGYEQSAGAEGDPILLVSERQVTFWNAKRVLGSTCTIKGDSRIEAAYEDTDKRRYHVPCPHCTQAAGQLDGFQVLKWRRLIKDQEPTVENTIYPCEHCGAALTEFDKSWMLERGEWRADRPEIKKKRGYWINALYSPFETWAKLVEKFHYAVRHRENPELLKTFINLSLAETYEEQGGDEVAGDELMRRREDYPHTAAGVFVFPDGVTVVTAGVDVQQDRIELLVIGFGKGGETWFGPRVKFDGDTTVLAGRKKEDGTYWPSPWERLDEYLEDQRFLHARGVRMEIAACLVDSSDNTQVVYEWTRTRNHRRIFASKGVAGFGKPPLFKWNRNNRTRTKLYPVGVDVIKDNLYKRLRLSDPGAGFIHFDRALHDADFFTQLTAEKISKKYVHGRPVKSWVLKVAGSRNEVLDMAVYAHAAFLSLSEKPEQMIERLRKDMLAHARQLAAERRAGIDPNQLALLTVAEDDVVPVVSTPGPAPKQFACADHGAQPDASCAICGALERAPEPPVASATADGPEGPGADEYQLAAQLDPPEPLPATPATPRTRTARRSSWLKGYV